MLNRNLTCCIWAIWSLTLAPALCRGGMLLHACDSETVECCANDCEDHCDDSAPCSHESDCESDPCSVLLTRPEQASRSLELVCLTNCVVPLNSISDVTALPYSDIAAPPPDPLTRCLSCADSDLPLIV